MTTIALKENPNARMRISINLFIGIGAKEEHLKCDQQ